MLISRRAFGRLFVTVPTAALVGCARGTTTSAPDSTVTMRIGYFPNITHSQAVIGIADGTFTSSLGSNVKLQVSVFNAGPSAIEAMFAGQLDLTYIGPNPAINGYVKSNGEALRIVAGATSGGAVLVVRSDAGISQPSDFAGRKIASPQLGNTQDVALRAWLLRQGFKLKEQGGNTEVIPTANPDIMTLFLKKEIDAAWVPEPWGARLVHEAAGQIFLDERDLWPDGQFVTAHIIVSTKFLSEHADLVKKWLSAHVELTQSINADPGKARQTLNSEIERLTGKKLPEVVLEDAWSRLTVTWDPISSSLLASADAAFEAGFLGDTKPNLDHIYDLTLLNEVLQAKGLPPVQ